MAPDILRRRRQNSGSITRVGPGLTVGGGGNVLQDGFGNKPRKDQDRGLHSQVHLVGVGGACIQASGDG